MSKYVKNLIADHVRTSLEGVSNAVLVNVIGLSANDNSRLRSELRGKKINLMVVKNSLAIRALGESPLAPMFEDVTGSVAVCWGGDDIVSLAKEVVRLIDSKQYAALEARGGAMDGAKLSPAQVTEVSKWPTREEQLSLLVGQILGPGSRLAGQLLGPGGKLASQIEEKAKGGEEAAAPAEAAPA